MNRAPAWRSLAALALIVGGAVWLRLDALRAPFFSDDYLFLDLVRARGLLAALAAPDAIGNFLRPVGRALWFWVLAHASGESPSAFHVANLVLFVVALALLFVLVRDLVGARGATVATAFVALSHAPDVAVRWASGAQDLLALVFALATLVLHRAGRRWLATACLVLALLSKETVAATPLLAVMLGRRADERWRDALRRAWPLFAGAAAWAVAWWATLPGRVASGATLSFAPSSVPAALAHLVQTAFGFEWAPDGWRPALPAPATLIAMALALAGLGLAFAAGTRPATATDLAPAAGAKRAAKRGAPAGRPGPRPSLRPAFVAGLAWALLGAAPVALVAPIWSAYFYVFALCGVALALGALFAARAPVLAAAVVVVLGWCSGGARALDEFTQVPDAWATVSHVNPRYLERAALATEGLTARLRAARPTLAPGTTLFISGLPAWSGMQAGGGPFVRWVYRDTSLSAHLTSQFSSATARSGTLLFVTLQRGGLLLNEATPDALAELSISLLLDGSTDGARDAMRMRERVTGPRPDVDYALAWMELARGDSVEARRRLRSVGAAADGDAHVEIAAALVQVASGDTAGAYARMDEAVVRHPLDPRAHVLLAGIALARPSTQLAGVLEAFAARALAPTWPPAWLRWSQAQLVGHRDARALESVERYLQLGGPRAAADPEVIRYRDELRRRMAGGDLARAAVRAGVPR